MDYTPVFGPDGKVVAIAAASAEITRQRQAEAVLMKSEKLAAVGRLASSIAHEINNPLEAVTNLLYLVHTYDLPDEIKTYIDIAERELRRASAITNQTLRFHKQTTNPSAVNCEALIAEILLILQGKIVNSKVNVQSRYRRLGKIHCFEGEIRQVLSNLIGNAIDAMHPKGGMLLLRTRNATDSRTGEERIALTIADTGSGMSRETVRNLFEPFFTTKGHSGTGLGLWISQEIIKRHHGSIRVRSSQSPHHRGSVFVIYLPASNQIESQPTLPVLSI
jgi:signal transduction histidine kinase